MERLIDSLDGEITQCWPLNDRADYFSTTALHFEDDATTGHDDDDDSRCKAPPSTASKLLDTKIQGRLSNLVERSVLVQLVVGFYLSRNDPSQAADLIWRYILSTAPAKNEQYPKFAPALSFVVL